MHDYDLAGIDDYRYSLQPVTDARACNTIAIIESEQGIMCRTLDIVLVQAQEPVRHPVQRATGMRAVVQVGKYLHSPSHNKDIEHLFIQGQRQPPATRIMQFIQMANDCVTGCDHRHSGSFPDNRDNHLACQEITDIQAGFGYTTLCQALPVATRQTGNCIRVSVLADNAKTKVIKTCVLIILAAFGTA